MFELPIPFINPSAQANEKNRLLALSLAQAFVASRYGFVPPIVLVMLMDKALFARARHFPQLARDLEAEMSRSPGYWLVAFKCSWDTDAIGMPKRLFVAVDVGQRTVWLHPNAEGGVEHFPVPNQS